jgi:hypothetical protein
VQARKHPLGYLSPTSRHTCLLVPAPIRSLNPNRSAALSPRIPQYTLKGSTTKLIPVSRPQASLNTQSAKNNLYNQLGAVVAPRERPSDPWVPPKPSEIADTRPQT